MSTKSTLSTKGSAEIRRADFAAVYPCGIYHDLYHGVGMQTAKLFKNGRSQAVRLPKDCQFAGDEVFVRKYRDVVILFPKQSPWAPLVSSLDEFTGDFLADRGQPERQDRREL